MIAGATLRTLTLKFTVPPPGDGFEMRPLSVAGFAVSEAGNWKTAVFPVIDPLTLPSVAVVDPMKLLP